MKITELPTFVSPIPLPDKHETRRYEDVDKQAHIVVWDRINHVEVNTHGMNEFEVVRSIRVALNALTLMRKASANKRRLN